METLIGGIYRVVKKLGSGSFGEVFEGIDVETKEKVAIKMERKDSKYPQLYHESKVYRHLSDGTGIPDIRWYGTEGDHNILVLDHLGPNLEDIFRYCERKFKLKTVLMLADQMIERIEYIHRRSVLHRDLKPENFLMGIGPTSKLVHLIDFGLAKQFQDSNYVRHIPLMTNKSLVGTARYASINSHKGIEQSRRDDMESLGYLLIYFLKGKLPWQDLKESNNKRKHEMIGEMKMATPIESLCESCPQEFASYFHYCRSLGFEDAPDYAYLRNSFRELFVSEGYQDDNVFDWSIILKRHRISQKADVPRALPPQQAEPSSPKVTPPPPPPEAFPLPRR